MLDLTFSRIQHQSSPLSHNFSRYIVVTILSLLCSLFFASFAHAESNVAGDEIIIFADDTFKPAPTNLGNSNTTDPTAYLNDDGSSQLDQLGMANDDLWQRIREGYAIPNSNSALITHHENWYSTRPDYVKRMVERSQKYLFHIVEEVEKRGMPTEIALLPMIESAYNPQAYSRSRASGIWQFIPSTGKNYGLKQNWWVDNRRNVTAATDAALNYLQKLHGMFGAWDLALAAYNAGEGTVSRAIERNRRLGLPTDYENLKLPPETRNYVPKLQAIKNLMTTPSNYGLQIQTIANSAYFTKVSAPAQIDAHLAARLAEISDEEFLALNPSYNRPIITNNETNNGKHELLLPISVAETFKDNLASYNKPLVSWQTYHAKRGERMDKIAQKFGINVAQLRNINDLPANKKIKKSSTILVPNGNKATFDAKAKAAALADTPEEASNITATNHIDAQQGEPEIITEISTVASEPVALESVTHIVKRGEGLSAIAKRYDTTVAQIKASNGLKSNRLKVGQVLNIEASDATANQSNNETKVNVTQHIRKKTYIVKRGDTLHSIAQKFDVAVGDIKRWNNIASSNIQPGHKLTIKSPEV